MPTHAISQALTCLLPSLPASNKPFPPALVSQCESFLALSRQRASNLKAEEEIARAHACAEIACNRLRAQLRLPAIKNGVGAPCKPRVYAKLVTFLDGVLGDAPMGSMTPKGRKRDASGTLKETPASGSGRRGHTNPAVMEERTPTKKSTPRQTMEDQFVGTIKKAKKGKGDDEKTPAFVMPTIRQICKMFSTPSLVPHIYTGISVVIGLSELWSPDVDMTEDLKSDVSCLVIALYLMVLTRMQQGEMTTETYTEVLDKILQSQQMSEKSSSQVEDWINKLNAEDWCNGQDWWESVPEGVIIFDPQATNDAGDQEVSVESDALLVKKRMQKLDKEDPEGVLLPGLGTMLHEGNDWLSEDKRLDYREWHSSILRRINTVSKPKTKKGRAIAVG